MALIENSKPLGGGAHGPYSIEPGDMPITPLTYAGRYSVTSGWTVRVSAGAGDGPAPTTYTVPVASMLEPVKMGAVGGANVSVTVHAPRHWMVAVVLHTIVVPVWPSTALGPSTSTVLGAVEKCRPPAAPPFDG